MVFEKLSMNFIKLGRNEFSEIENDENLVRFHKKITNFENL
jgi:hypothetical protein